MNSLYHIYISPKKGISREQIENKMNLAIDWFRYDDNNWIVFTTSDAKKWYSRLEYFAKTGGNLLICKLDPDDYWGLMSEKLWPWLLEKKGKIT